MNIKVETKCKFCHRDIEMDVDESGFKNPMIKADLWLKNVACNRCAGFYLSKQSSTESIIRVCFALATSRKAGGDRKFEDIIRPKLEEKTKSFCRLICDFKFAQFTWDIEFVNMLMDQPEKCGKIINFYTSNLNSTLAALRT